MMSPFKRAVSVLALSLMIQSASAQEEILCKAGKNAPSHEETLKKLKAIDQFLLDHHQVIQISAAGIAIVGALGSAYAHSLDGKYVRRISDLKLEDGKLTSRKYNTTLQKFISSKLESEIKAYLKLEQSRISQIAHKELEDANRTLWDGPEEGIHQRNRDLNKIQDLHDSRWERARLQYVHSQLDNAHMDDFIRYLKQHTNQGKMVKFMESIKKGRHNRIQNRLALRKEIMTLEAQGAQVMGRNRLIRIGTGAVAAAGLGSLVFIASYPAYLSERENILKGEVNFETVERSPMENTFQLSYNNSTLLAKKLGSDECIAAQAEMISQAIPNIEEQEIARLAEIAATVKKN
jgi:hypothetical protein